MPIVIEATIITGCAAREDIMYHTSISSPLTCSYFQEQETMVSAAIELCHDHKKKVSGTNIVCSWHSPERRLLLPWASWMWTALELDTPKQYYIFAPQNKTRNNVYPQAFIPSSVCICMVLQQCFVSCVRCFNQFTMFYFSCKHFFLVYVVTRHKHL